MADRMIYSALDQGSAGKGMGVVIVAFFVSAIIIYFVVALRNSRKAGMPIKSKSKTTTALWTSIAKYPISTIVAVIVLNLMLSAVFGLKYYDYVIIIRSHGFNTAESTLEENLVDQVTLPTASSSPKRQIKMSELTGVTTIHETDRLKVDGRYFYVECDLTSDGLHPAEPGKIGGCLPLHPGNMVRVDYIPVPPDRYRREPLHVWLLDQSATTAH